VVTEYFVAGSEPVETCPLHADGPDSWFTRTFGDIFGGGGDEHDQQPSAPRPKPQKQPLTPGLR
jgi:hypothetical protein